MFNKNQNSASPYQSFGAIFLILLGGIYLLATFDVISWAAIGIIGAFVPAAWVIHCGWRIYRETGQLNRWVLVHLLWGLFPFVFLGLWQIGFSMGKLWPIALVFIGLTMLFNRSEA